MSRAICEYILHKEVAICDHITSNQEYILHKEVGICDHITSIQEFICHLWIECLNDISCKLFQYVMTAVARSLSSSRHIHWLKDFKRTKSNARIDKNFLIIITII